MRKRLVFLLVPLLAAALWGCGSNRDSGGDQTADPSGTLGSDPVTGLAFVGSTTCIGCHAGFSWSRAEVEAYLAGKHVENHAGSRTYAEMVADGCTPCHDPVGDSPRMSALVGRNVIAVGCENCHGAGGGHFGVGPIPVATPDFNACGKCHNAAMDHNRYHPEGDNIVEDFAASAHAEADGRNAPVCVKCHNDEGARKYKDVGSWEALAVTLPVAGETHAIQCRTCHDPHSPGQLLKPEETSGRGASERVVASAEYATCTNCHQQHDAELATDPFPGATTDGPSGDLIYHAKRWDRVIASTHYDDSATNDADGNALLEGYVMDPASDRVCRDCHNVHAADTTINRQWARSGHGGRLLDVKEKALEDYLSVAGRDEDDFAAVQAVRAAGSEASWAGHGWPNDGEAACQRCHTATGFKNYIADTAAYFAAMDAFLADQDLAVPTGVESPNDFSHLETNAAGDYVQQEMLFCWACHADNSGALRSTGKTVQLQDRAGEIFATIPNIGASTVCAGCHGGRANSDYIALLPAASRSTSSRHHHAPAVLSLFSAITHGGFEFDLDGDGDGGEHYANVPFFRHDEIGLNGDTPESGVGPCAGCHMRGDAADHTFEVASKQEDATGAFVAYTAISNQSLCNTCHTAHPMDAALLTEERLGYDNAKELFATFMAPANNFTGLDLNTNAGVRAAPDVATYGAQQNLKYVQEDFGGFAHNRFYVKRLIFDSIDWLDNGTFDGVIHIDAAVYPEAAAWLGAATAEDVAADPSLTLGDTTRP